MAKQGFRIADSDMHVLEPADLWLNYIDPRFKARAPVGLTEVPRDVAIEWEGKRIPNNTSLSRRMLQVVQAGQADRYAHAERRGYDAVAQVEAMDQEGIDVAVLFPSRGLFALAVDGMDPELAAAIARAYNEWLAHFCPENPPPLLRAAPLAPHQRDAAVAEARRTVTELGFRAMFMRPNPINGRYRSEEHTSELQSQSNLVCRLLLEKKKKQRNRLTEGNIQPPTRRKCLVSACHLTLNISRVRHVRRHSVGGALCVYDLCTTLYVCTA